MGKEKAAPAQEVATLEDKWPFHREPRGTPPLEAAMQRIVSTALAPGPANGARCASPVPDGELRAVYHVAGNPVWRYLLMTANYTDAETVTAIRDRLPDDPSYGALR